MNLNELKKLVNKTIKEQGGTIVEAWSPKNVRQHWETAIRIAPEPERKAELTTLYDMIFTNPDEAVSQAEEIEYSPSIVSRQIRDLAGAEKDVSEPEIKPQAGPEGIKVVDPEKLRGPGTSMVRLKGYSEEEAQAERDNMVSSGGEAFPGRVVLYKDPTGEFFIWSKYKSLGS